ncbi:MAG TPA: hypothetical protein VGG01_06795 [Xanthobacteraceae bacterium]|jgi:hypothetical protein
MAEKSDRNTAQFYEAEAEALRAKTAKLRELRLAREVQEAALRPPAPVRAPRGAAKKKAAPKSTGTLADWIKAREDGGHNN